MLEENIPDNSILIRCFVNGVFSYYKNADIPVSTIKSFLTLLRQSTKEKKNIILSHIHSRLDAIDRQEERPGDDIPF